MNLKPISAIAAIALTSACATNPNKISAAYVSPLKYENYDCQQIAMEMDAVQRKGNQLFQTLKGRNTNDKWMMGVGLAVAWPALFFLKGKNGQLQGEYAQLKGEYDALQTSAVRKKCGMGQSTTAESTVPATTVVPTATATPVAARPSPYCTLEPGTTCGGVSVVTPKN